MTSATHTYEELKKQKQDLEDFEKQEPSKESKTGKFRFSDQDREIEIFGSNDVELLESIDAFLDAKNAAGITKWKGVENADWKKDLADRVARLNLKKQKMELDEAIKKVEGLMDKDDILAGINSKFKIPAPPKPVKA